VSHLTRVLYAAAAALGLVGFAIQFAWPAARNADVAAVAVALPTSPSTVAAPVPSPLVFEDIVVLNVFSETRAPPRRRYVPASRAADTSKAEPPRRARPAGPSYRLSGIILTPEDTSALIDANPRVPGAEMYRVGDPIGTYRVRAIAETTVVLDGPRGRLELRLRTPRRAAP
jgi:hypothetical protein